MVALEKPNERTQWYFQRYLAHLPAAGEIRLVKLRFSVSRAEQRTRFLISRIDPVRQWKLSPMDLASLGTPDRSIVGPLYLHLDLDVGDPGEVPDPALPGPRRAVAGRGAGRGRPGRTPAGWWRSGSPRPGGTTGRARGGTGRSCGCCARPSAEGGGRT